MCINDFNVPRPKTKRRGIWDVENVKPYIVPVVYMDKLACRMPPSAEYIIDYLFLPPDVTALNYIGVRVMCNDMNMYQIFEGDTLLVSTNSRYKNGDVVVCLLSSKEVILRQYCVDDYIRRGSIMLKPISNNFQLPTFTLGVKNRKIRLLGKVLKIYSKL